MEALKPPLVGLYFFPQAYDKGRAKRAIRLGRDGHPPSDIQLSKRKPGPGLQGGYQPKEYSIDLTTPITDWDDLNPKAVASQLRTLEQMGVDFIALDSFAGYRGGKTYVEYNDTAHIIADEIKKTRLKFYTNMCLKLPRAILPVSQPNYNEPFRDFDLTIDTFETMMRYSALFWNNPNYLRVLKRPVMGIYGLTAEKVHRLTFSLPELYSKSLATNMKSYVWQRIDKDLLEPFMIGIVDVPLMVPVLSQLGFEMVTTMSGLPNFFHSSLIPEKALELMPHISEDVQGYLELLSQRIQEWYTLAHTIDGRERGVSHFIPSISLGWDSRPRAQDLLPLSFVGYPNHPVVEEPDIKQLETAFEQLKLYLATITRTLTFPFRYEGVPIVHIFAANEVGEGACVYPRVIDGKIDRSKYDALGQMIASLHEMRFSDPYAQFVK